MIITPGSSIAGFRIVKTFGLVRGKTVRARNIGRDLLAVLKNMIGGEIEEYSKLMGESRDQALDRMSANAAELGANAVIDMRFMTSFIMGAASEILAYGNAVYVEPE
ncbi:MAG: YbjQ family protein [Gemmatimonadales bacterium]|nr:YbjQ family protein [Gemmatimonadales bacterium]